jgi:cell division protein FtsW
VADGDGYQLVQSLVAVASGGLWGNGFGQSVQKVSALPIQYSDFIFAVFAEEFGFLGCSLAILFLLAYGGLAWWIAASSTRLSHQLVAIGTLVALVGQASINIGVVTGVLPTTGLPLPLFSYGGSSMVSSLAIAALLVRVARENRQAEVIEFDRGVTASESL